jgi:CheY-like chemotaxis protein/nitrogen-specific signal transduction histidine kinase
MHPWLNPDGTVAGIIIVLDPIDDLVKTRERAIEAARRKAEFLANMSHEIRTPMNGVLGMAHLLLETELTSEQQECAQAIRSSAESLLRVINDILDFSKIEAGKLEIESIDLDVTKVVEETIGLMARQARIKGLELKSAIANRLPRRLRGDPFRLRQVLINLLGNAVKFTDHGAIVVAVEPLGDAADSIVLRFTIQDSGIGLTADTRLRLFQAFAQGDVSRARHNGTGLGLCISRQLCEMMGGNIGVESEPGVGSMFWFTVRFAPVIEPAAQPSLVSHDQAPAQVAAARLKVHQTGGRVLLAEDDAVNRLVAMRTLAKLGYDVTIARHGREAVALCQQQDFDLVLMDCEMPEMDGFEATRRIRELATPAAKLPIIAVTAHAMKGDEQRCLAAGMDDYISKPLQVDTLVMVLNRWVRMALGDANGSTAAVSPLDADVIQGLRDLDDGNNEVLAELIQVFCEDAPTHLQGLRQAATRGDCRVLAQHAHGLKGSSSNLGAHVIAGLCDRLEKIGNSGGIDAAALELLGELEVEYDRAENALRALV